MISPLASRRRRGGDGRPGVLLEVIGLLLWFLLFTSLHSAAGTDFAAATANALALQSAEHTMHIDIERSANHWLAGHLVLSHLAVYLYRLYYAVIAGVLLWVYIRHADVYRPVRRTLVAMMVLILPVYWAVPMSPPRFALPGVVDIVARYDILGHASRATGNGENHYSAMPSLHVGWSLWCAYAVWSAVRVAHPRLALLSWMFPLSMAADVLTTGNHYVLDVAGSIVVLAVSIVAASMCGRLAERCRSRYRTSRDLGRSLMRVAAAQPSVRADDVAANAARHAEIIRAADARLVVFPELSLTGYYLDAPAIPTDDPRLEPIIAACAATGAVALIGAPIADPDGREYIATLRVDGDGATVAYRKINVYPPEDERFSAGTAYTVMVLDEWRLGLAICRDASLPEHAAGTVAAGAEVYVASTYNSPTDPRDERMRERSSTHRIPVVLACAAAQNGSGGSGFWAADGRVRTQAGGQPDEVVSADLRDLVAARV